MSRKHFSGASVRTGARAFAVALALGGSFGPISVALAQSPPAVEVAQVSMLASNIVALAKAFPTDTSQDVFEAQFAAAIEAAGMSGDVTRMALQSVLRAEGLPGGAIGAIRSLLVKGISGRMRSTAALIGGAGGPGFGQGFASGIGGGGSDY